MEWLVFLLIALLGASIAITSRNLEDLKGRVQELEGWVDDHWEDEEESA